MHKLLKKIKLHFTDPGKALFFDLRICFNFYSKLMLVYYYKINIPKSDFLITPDYIDLYNLFKNILKRRPNCVLEIGAGYSTIVVLQALKIMKRKHGINVIFYSLEQNQEYLNKMKSFFNKDDFLILKFVKTELNIINLKGSKVSICSNFPSEQINFLYEDRADHSEYKIAGDALFIEKDMPKDYFICVDGMKESVNFYKKNLERKYKISKGIFAGTNFEPKL